MYNNSVQLFNIRIILFKILDYYMEDSQIVSISIKIFRKTLQTFCKYKNPLLQKGELLIKVDTLTFYNEIKVCIYNKQLKY